MSVTRAIITPEFDPTPCGARVGPGRVRVGLDNRSGIAAETIS